MFLKKVVNTEHIVSTIALDQSTGQILDEKIGVFDFSQLSNKNSVLLFVLNLKDRGTIILDLF